MKLIWISMLTCCLLPAQARSYTHQVKLLNDYSTQHCQAFNNLGPVSKTCSGSPDPGYACHPHSYLKFHQADVPCSASSVHIRPPNPSIASAVQLRFTSINSRYNIDPQYEWVFRARMGFGKGNLGNFGDGVHVQIVVGADASSGMAADAVLWEKTFTTADTLLDVSVPLGDFARRGNLRVGVQVDPRANNDYDTFIVDEPVLAAYDDARYGSLMQPTATVESVAANGSRTPLANGWAALSQGWAGGAAVVPIAEVQTGRMRIPQLIHRVDSSIVVHPPTDTSRWTEVTYNPFATLAPQHDYRMVMRVGLDEGSFYGTPSNGATIVVLARGHDEWQVAREAVLFQRALHAGQSVT